MLCTYIVYEFYFYVFFTGNPKNGGTTDFDSHNLGPDSVSFLRNAVENFNKLEFVVAADDEQSDIEDVSETRESP